MSYEISAFCCDDGNYEPPIPPETAGSGHGWIEDISELPDSVVELYIASCCRDARLLNIPMFGPIVRLKIEELLRVAGIDKKVDESVFYALADQFRSSN